MKHTPILITLVALLANLSALHAKDEVGLATKATKRALENAPSEKNRLLVAAAQEEAEPAATLPWKTNNPIATVKKELYLPQAAKGISTIVRVRYTGEGLEREEEQLVGVLLAGKKRLSPDNGRTWSTFTPLSPSKLPDGPRAHAMATFYDPVTKMTVRMSLLISKLSPPNEKLSFLHMSASTSSDGGQTWSPDTLLRYEDGDDFDPNNPLKESFLLHNRAYGGNNIIRHSNGTLIYCVGKTVEPGSALPLSALCFIGTWDPKAQDYHWVPGQRISLKKEEDQSGRGFEEPNVSELSDGRVLVVWRRGRTAKESIRKWYSISSDGGRTLSPAAEWKYEDGSRFFAPTSYHLTLRHSVTGKLYWIGNIVAGPHPSGETQPRFPLVIAEVDETIPAIKRGTVMAIDDRAEGESDRMHLSNFSVLEDRETHAIEVYLTRLGADPKDFWHGDTYKYTLTLRDESTGNSGTTKKKSRE